MKNRLNTLKEIEEELNISLRGSSRQPSASRDWEFRGHRSVSLRLRQLGTRGKHGGGSSGNPRQQRVVVKASYTVHKPGKARGVLRAHTIYLARDSASLDGEPGRFYDARDQDVEIKARVRDWEEDRHHFRFIVSPEYGHRLDRQPGGLTEYVRELMVQMEKDMHTKLEWVAVNHHNTDEPHAHVLVRGKRQDGKDLVIPRDYMARGMREAAQQIATRRLGERRRDQVREQLQKEVRADRYTPLDAAIEKRLDGDRRLRLKALDRDRGFGGGDQRRRVAARLAHLEQMGLASRDRHGRWTVDAELKPKLREVAQRDDIIKNLYRTLGSRSASVSAYRGEGELVGAVAGRGTHDELRDSRYLLVRDAEQQMQYVRVSNPEALAALDDGGLVRVLPGDPHRARTDARIAEVARDNGGIYSRDAHRRSLPAHFAAGDVDSFLRSHERRIQTLERAGAAARIPGAVVQVPGVPGGGWVIRDPEALVRGEQARNHGGAGTVEVLSARSIESQVQAAAWTWLDRQMHRQDQGQPAVVAFEAALEHAAEARRRWMIEHGHVEVQGGRYTLRAGTAEALRRQERQTVEQEQQERFGKPIRVLPPGAETTGAYRGMVALHDGLHAAIVSRRDVALAPVKRVPPLEYGTPVQAKVNARGQAILSRTPDPRTAGSTQQRQRERGLERG